MAYEWIPLASAGVAVGATVLIASLGYRHAERMADKRNEHERQLAADARKQQRLADAYVEVLEVVQRFAQWAAMIRPAIEIGPSLVIPPLPSLADQARTEALVSAFASDEVIRLMHAWKAVLNRIRVAEMTIDVGTAHPVHIDVAEHWRKLEEDIRPAEKAALEAIVQRISMELGHRSAPSSW